MIFRGALRFMTRERVPELPPERSWIAPMELDPGRTRPTSVVEGGAEPEPTDTDATAAELPPRRRRRAGVWLAGAVAALVAVALGFDTVDLLQRAFAASSALGTLVAAVVAVAGVSLIKMLADELRSLRRLRAIEGLRLEAARLTANGNHGEAGIFAGEVAALYADRSDLTVPLDRLRQSLTDAHNDREVVQLIDRQVLEVLDRRAYQMVLRAARDTAIATALSPAAVIDLAVVLWRNLKLVREIATMFGGRPGYVGSLRLLRRMLANLAVAGLAESANHVAVDALGGTIAAAISTRVGQGVINGLLTARVGVTAMHLCRPVEYRLDNRPSLKRIRGELMSVSKQVL